MDRKNVASFCCPINTIYQLLPCPRLPSYFFQIPLNNVSLFLSPVLICLFWLKLISYRLFFAFLSLKYETLLKFCIDCYELGLSKIKRDQRREQHICYKTSGIWNPNSRSTEKDRNICDVLHLGLPLQLQCCPFRHLNCCPVSILVMFLFKVLQYLLLQKIK